MEPPKAYLGLLAVLALALGACGGGNERSKLQQQISSGLTKVSTPPDLVSCISSKSVSLPISQQRKLASPLAAGRSPDLAPGQPYANLTAECFAQGRGVDGFRQSVSSQAASSVPASAPAFRSCLQTRFGALPAQQLSDTVKKSGLTQDAGRRLGSTVAAQCIDQPGVLGELKAVFLASAITGAKNSKLSPAFKECFTRKAQNVPEDLLKKAVLAGPGAQATALGQDFGRQIGKQCLAEGV
jgi:hypothetical protein